MSIPGYTCLVKHPLRPINIQTRWELLNDIATLAVYINAQFLQYVQTQKEVNDIVLNYRDKGYKVIINSSI